VDSESRTATGYTLMERVMRIAREKAESFLPNYDGCDYTHRRWIHHIGAVAGRLALSTFLEYNEFLQIHIPAGMHQSAMGG
jgi:hypothetical protein